MKTRFYIAGAWSHRDEIARKAAQLESEGGLECTYKWYAKSEGLDKRADALFDQQGVERADVVIIVADDPTYVYRGTLVELGMALALRKTTLLLLPPDADAFHSDVHKCVFVHAPGVSRVASWEDVLRVLGVHATSGEAPQPRGDAAEFLRVPKRVRYDTPDDVLEQNRLWIEQCVREIAVYADRKCGFSQLDPETAEMAFGRSDSRFAPVYDVLRTFLRQWAPRAYWSQNTGQRCECTQCVPPVVSTNMTGLLGKKLRIGANGDMGSGKSTLVRRLRQRYGGVELSFAAPLYEIMHFAQKKIGVPLYKDRAFLQKIGSDFARSIDQNIWIMQMTNKVTSALSNGENIYVSDARYPNEIDALVKMEFRIVRITRPQSDNALVARAGTGSVVHSSEGACASISMETIDNDHSLSDFIAKIDDFDW